MITALPTVQLRDRHNRVLSVVRQASPGMHPGPAIVPIRVGAGHRAAIELRWIAGPVFEHSRSVRTARVTVKIGSKVLTAPLIANMYGEAGRPVMFEQSQLRAVEGMAAG